ncbi:MAG TPA: transporter substrate-binding domain-containing protein [Bacillota bacterium]|nr:transporter substrate-binding domain-containing protein [Bacillota bacterium]
MKKITSVLLLLLLVFTVSACNNSTKVKTLRVAMECSYAPYNWAQDENTHDAVKIADSSQYANGYDVMIAKKIAEKLGYQLEIVKLDWDSLVPAVQSGDVDAAIAGQSITAERQEQVDFSDPYYYASIVTLTTKDSAYAAATTIADFSGGTATSQLGTVWYDVCLPQIMDANILPAQETAPSMLVALESKAVDFVVCDLPTAMAAVKVYDDLIILDFTGTDGNFQVSEEEVNLGISVKKGNTELLDVINSVLTKMTVSDFETMMDEAISIQPLAE